MGSFYLPGKQVLDGTIDENKLASSVSGGGLTGGGGSALAVGAGTGVDVQANSVGLLTATGSVTYSGSHVSTHTIDTLQVSGTPDSANDPVNKAYADSLNAGIKWKSPVKALSLVGERSVAQIDALSPALGDAAIATDAGTPSAGTSDLLAAGDVAEFDGTSWIKVLDQVGGRVPNDVRFVVSTTATLFSPFTASTDEGKIVVTVSDPGSFDGAVIDANDTGDGVDGNAVLIRCGPGAPADSALENQGYVFDGTVPTGSWTQFVGPGSVVGGAGITEAGSVFNVVAADNSMSIGANDLQVNAGNGLAVGSNLAVDAYSGADTSVAPVLVDADGVGVDTDDSSIEHTAGVLSIKANGVGPTELNEGGSFNITGSLQAPTQSGGDNTTNVATTAFVQGELGGLAGDIQDGIKTLVVVAAEANNINIASAPANIDGFTASVGDLILLLNQSTASQNGIWEYQGSGNALTRPAKYSTGASVAGYVAKVVDGTTHDDLSFIVTNDLGSDIVDTDNLVHAVYSSLLAGNGVTFGGTLGNDVSVAADATGGANLATVVSVSGNGVAIAIDDDTVAENGSNQLIGPKNDVTDYRLNPSASSGADDFDTGITLSNTPGDGRLPFLFLNGSFMCIARNDGERATSPFYFGTTGGTAKADGAIASGDKLFFNAAFVGADLAASDEIYLPMMRTF